MLAFMIGDHKKKISHRRTKSRKKRFARDHIHYTVEFWRKVIFSDEKTFSSDGYSPQWVHRLPGGDTSRQISLVVITALEKP